jgi:glycerol-3-phosphate dehydrogenase
VRRDLAALAAREHDLVVVGGGAYGAAAAWDAAARGLAVALVEREDFGAGASWNSLKTIHGGMRYLQRLDLARLRSSARERHVLMRLAPALVRPLPFLVPAYGHGRTGREALAIGFFLNDWATRDRNDGLPESHRIPDARILDRDETRRLVPGIDARGLTGAAFYLDAQAVSTERLTLAFVHAAAGEGACCANHAEATALLRAAGRVAGVALRDTLTGATIEVRARAVLNAAGPWADDLLDAFGLRRGRSPLLRARNLVLRRAPALPFAVGGRSAGRYLFLVPWQGVTMLGTSYEEAAAPPSDPMEFLREGQAAFPWAQLRREDVSLVHEGLVPGRGDARGLSTTPRLHDHGREDGLAGLVSVQGVKYTTARLVAEKAVDLVARGLGRPEPSRRTAAGRLAKARLLDGPLEDRAREAVREEMALTLADAVLRRLDLGTAGRPDAGDLETVARVLRAELGWDEERLARERAALDAFFPA